MQIKSLTQDDVGREITIEGVLASKSLLEKANKDKYLLVTITDETSSISFPIWDRVAVADEVLVVGNVYNAKGKLGFYNGNYQLQDAAFFPSDKSPVDFLAEYTISEEMAIYFNSVALSLPTMYRRLVTDITGWTSDLTINELFQNFIKAPAAEKHHQNKIGGLFIHTVGVMKAVESMINTYEGMFNFDKHINRDRLMLKAILHDAEKMTEYEYSTIIKRRDVKLGHIERVVSKIWAVDYLEETEKDDICYSILSHHGSYGKYEPKSIEDKMLHLADMIDSQIFGVIEN